MGTERSGSPEERTGLPCSPEVLWEERPFSLLLVPGDKWTLEQ